MKYLKLFNESLDTNSWLDKDFSSPEEIAKLIDSYFRDHDYSNLMQNMHDLLIQTHPNDDYAWAADELPDELMRYDDILLVVNTLIENSKEPWWSVKFERFLGFLAEIQEESQHGLSIEEIEDFFLDLDYKYNITKINIAVHGESVPAFKVEVNKVTDSDSMMLINRFWNTVGGRLPKEYQINKLEMERKKAGIYFTLVIVKKVHESFQ
jgi:hypothetical protein